jgi:Domain of unknown function (DUF397)
MEQALVVTPWIKATASAGTGNCVELAQLADGGVAVRDSKDVQGPMLRFTHAEFEAFLLGAKSAEFDGLVG